jgi:predicted CopG family antitoxin
MEHCVKKMNEKTMDESSFSEEMMKLVDRRKDQVTALLKVLGSVRSDSDEKPKNGSAHDEGSQL